MKKLILIILISFSFSEEWWRGDENPDGKPFRLGITTSIVGFTGYSFDNKPLGGEEIEESRLFIFGFGTGDYSESINRVIRFKMPLSNEFTLSQFLGLR